MHGLRGQLTAQRRRRRRRRRRCNRARPSSSGAGHSGGCYCHCLGSGERLHILFPRRRRGERLPGFRPSTRDSVRAWRGNRAAPGLGCGRSRAARRTGSHHKHLRRFVLARRGQWARGGPRGGTANGRSARGRRAAGACKPRGRQRPKQLFERLRRRFARTRAHARPWLGAGLVVQRRRH